MFNAILKTLLRRQLRGDDSEEPLPEDGTCHTIDDDSVADNIIGDFTFHEIMTWTALATSVFVVIVCGSLCLGHILNYRQPQVQKHLIRLILVVPVFSVFCALGVWNYHITDYMLPVAALYEAFAFVSALHLCIFYLVFNTDWATQVQYFSQAENQGFKIFRKRYILVSQVLPCTAILFVAEIVVYAVECARSNEHQVLHLVIAVLDAITLGLAIWGMFPFLSRHSKNLTASEPTIWGKLIFFKLVVFLGMLQQLILGILRNTDVLTESATLSYNDLHRGLDPFITCCICFFLSIGMVYYYNPRLHGSSEDMTHGGNPGEYYQQVHGTDLEEAASKGMLNRKLANPKMPAWRALWDTINMTDILVGMGRAATLIFRRRGGVQNQ